MRATLQFLGAARTVTGSRFLFQANGSRVLVDAGLFQGLKELRLRNWADLPVPPAGIDAVILTHAHIDHCGYLPRLVRQGFVGPVYCTPATAELIGIMLPDSARLQEEEAYYANRRGTSKHHPALPLYTEADAHRAIALARPVGYGARQDVAPGLAATFHPAGHILGSAFVELTAADLRVVFSGDVGAYDRVVMNPPADLPPDVDYLVVESTYGARRESSRPIGDQIEEHVRPALERGGVVVIPAFAVGRTTVVLYHLNRLMAAGRIPRTPVYVDSPMATDAVELYCRYGGEHNLRIDLLRDPGACPIRTSTTRLVRTVEDSKRLNGMRGPMIIISASGMATGGRVIHHLMRRLPDPRNLVLLVGYQAAGTRGRRLLDGEPEVKIFGKFVPVKATIASIAGLSAHGDSDDLVRWMKTARRPPRRTFLVHGEADGLTAMARRADELGFPHHTPEYLEEAELET